MSVRGAPSQRSPEHAAAQRRVAGSVAVLAAGDFINKSARFAAVVVLTHALPLDQYGLLNLGVALGGIAVVVMRLGLPDLGAREAAIAPDRREDLAGRIVTPQAAGMLVLTFLACAVALIGARRRRSCCSAAPAHSG